MTQKIIDKIDNNINIFDFLINIGKVEEFNSNCDIYLIYIFYIHKIYIFKINH